MKAHTSQPCTGDQTGDVSVLVEQQHSTKLQLIKVYCNTASCSLIQYPMALYLYCTIVSKNILRGKVSLSGFCIQLVNMPLCLACVRHGWLAANLTKYRSVQG